MYQMTINYRLNTLGDHRPFIAIMLKDKQPMMISDHYELPTTRNGSWAMARFLFDLKNSPNFDTDYVRVTWPTSARATSDYDDISILTVLHDTLGPPDVFFVDQTVED